MKLVAAYISPPDAKEHASRLLFESSHGYVVYKQFDNPDIWTVKFWRLTSGSTVEETVKHWSTNQPFVPDAEMVTTARKRIRIAAREMLAPADATTH